MCLERAVERAWKIPARILGIFRVRLRSAARPMAVSAWFEGALTALVSANHQSVPVAHRLALRRSLRAFETHPAMPAA